MNVDIRTRPDVIDAINAVISNGGIAEVKVEGKDANLTVVEIRRVLKTKKK